MWNLGSGWKSTHWPGTKLKEDVIGVELSWIILSVRPVVTAGESCLRDCMVARCHVMGWSLLASYHRGSEESSGGWRQSSLEKKSFSFSSLPPSPTPSTSQRQCSLSLLSLRSLLQEGEKVWSTILTVQTFITFTTTIVTKCLCPEIILLLLPLEPPRSISISISIYYNYNGHLQKI